MRLRFCKTSFSCFAGLDVVRKLSRPLRKASRVTVSEDIRWTPTKCNENEGKVLLKETDSPKENHHSSSSPLPNDPNSVGVVNKGFYVSVLDLYSDGDTSRVGKEPAPTGLSAISVENKNAPLSETEANSQSVINSGNTVCAFMKNRSR